MIENGGDENQAIAGLLHGAAEDQTGAEILAKIMQRFGEDVAAIVARDRPPLLQRFALHPPPQGGGAISRREECVN